MMHFEQHNFFSNFNTRRKTYSKEEIEAVLEAEKPAKKRCLVDGKRVKQVSENDKSLSL